MLQSQEKLDKLDTKIEPYRRIAYPGKFYPKSQIHRRGMNGSQISLRFAKHEYEEELLLWIAWYPKDYIIDVWAIFGSVRASTRTKLVVKL